MLSVLLSFLELTLRGARREHSADGFSLLSRSRSGLLYKWGSGHPGRLLFGVVNMDRSEVVRMGSFHLYPLSILFFRIKILIHGLNLECEEVVLKVCRLCARSNIYNRQSELSLENNVLKAILIVAGIKRGIYQRVCHNGKISCRTVGEDKKVGAQLDQHRVATVCRIVITSIQNPDRTLAGDRKSKIGIVVCGGDNELNKHHGSDRP